MGVQLELHANLGEGGGAKEIGEVRDMGSIFILPY